MRLFRRRFRSDEEALASEEHPIDKAAAWAHHVVEREYPGSKVVYALTLLEVEVNGRGAIMWAGSDNDVSRLKIRGMLGEAEAGLEELAIRHSRRVDIDLLVDSVVERLNSRTAGGMDVEDEG